MSKKGFSPDNRACEGFFGRLKNEFFYHRSWDGVTYEQFADILNEYIDRYKSSRIKQSLGWMSPLNYRYVVNHSLKEYIDEMATPFCAGISSKDDVMGARVDPLPYLLAPNAYSIDDEVAGRWCPGSIEATNAEPPSGYANITHVATSDQR